MIIECTTKDIKSKTKLIINASPKIHKQLDIQFWHESHYEDWYEVNLTWSHYKESDVLFADMRIF